MPNKRIRPQLPFFNGDGKQDSLPGRFRNQKNTEGRIVSVLRSCFNIVPIARVLVVVFGLGPMDGDGLSGDAEMMEKRKERGNRGMEDEDGEAWEAWGRCPSPVAPGSSAEKGHSNRSR